MPKWLNIFAQVVGTVGQGLNVWGGFIPSHAQGWVAAGLAIAQAAVGILAHNFNPDGTPATVAFVPPPK